MTMSLSFEPLPSIYRSKQEFLASLPPWRQTIDVDVEHYAIEQEIKRLDEINVKLAAIVSGSATNLTPPPSTSGESET